MAVPHLSEVLSPSDPLEERSDLACRALRRLAMREMPDAIEHRQIQIRKRLAHAIGPGIGKQGIVLGPAHAGRHRDRREPWCFALHHLDAARMRGAVMRKAA